MLKYPNTSERRFSVPPLVPLILINPPTSPSRARDASSAPLRKKVLEIMPERPSSQRPRYPSDSITLEKSPQKKQPLQPPYQKLWQKLLPQKRPPQEQPQLLSVLDQLQSQQRILPKRPRLVRGTMEPKVSAYGSTLETDLETSSDKVWDNPSQSVILTDFHKFQNVDNPSRIFDIKPGGRRAMVNNFTWNDQSDPSPRLVGNYKNYYIPTYSLYYYRLYNPERKLKFYLHIPNLSNKNIVQLLKYIRNNLLLIMKRRYLETAFPNLDPPLENVTDTLDEDIDYWTYRKEFMANVLLAPYIYPGFERSGFRYVSPLDINEKFEPRQEVEASVNISPINETDRYGFQLKSQATSISFIVPNGSVYTYNYKYPSELKIVDYLREMREKTGPDPTNPEAFDVKSQTAWEWFLYHNLLKPYVYG